MASPFPGYFVLAAPEIFLNNIWGIQKSEVTSFFETVRSALIYAAGVELSESNWYRKYRSGWLEQGETIPQSAATGEQTINFYAPFSSKPAVIMQRESSSTIKA